MGTNEIDILAITKTWLKKDDDIPPTTIPPPGYDIMSSPSLDGRSGGGIILVFKHNYRSNIRQLMNSHQANGMNLHSTHLNPN